MARSPLNGKDKAMIAAVFVITLAIALAGMSLAFDRFVLAIAPAIGFAIAVSVSMFIYLSREKQQL